LLVALGILFILWSLVLPAVALARGRAQKTVCINNLRQIGQALAMYQQDHAGLLPPLLRTGLYPDYVPRSDAFVCPLDPSRGRPTLPPQRTPQESGPISYLWVECFFDPTCVGGKYFEFTYKVWLPTMSSEMPFVVDRFHDRDSASGDTRHLGLFPDGHVADFYLREADGFYRWPWLP